MFLDKINSLIEKGLCNENSRVLFVNDGSKDDTWNIIDLPPETAIERVSISLPSTNAGSNAANKTATITSSGYKAASIAGWTWASGGTRNNWFNFYRMDCDPTTGIVTVSACNTHASSAASGTVLVDVLLKRSDLI